MLSKIRAQKNSEPLTTHLHAVHVFQL